MNENKDWCVTWDDMRHCKARLEGRQILHVGKQNPVVGWLLTLCVLRRANWRSAAPVQTAALLAYYSEWKHLPELSIRLDELAQQHHYKGAVEMVEVLAR